MDVYDERREQLRTENGDGYECLDRCMYKNGCTPRRSQAEEEEDHRESRPCSACSRSSTSVTEQNKLIGVMEERGAKCIDIGGAAALTIQAEARRQPPFGFRSEA